MRYVSKKKKQILIRYWLATLTVSCCAYWTPWFVSIVVGALVFAVPSTLFAWFAFRVSGSQRSKQILAGFFLGEMMKWAATVVMFIGIYKHYAPYLNLEAMLVTYALMHVLGPLLMLTI